MYSTSPARQSAASRRSDQLFMVCSLIDASCQDDENNILPESTRSSQASHRAHRNYRNVSCCDRICEASSLRSTGRRTGRTAATVSGRRLCGKTRSLDWSATLREERTQKKRAHRGKKTSHKIVAVPSYRVPSYREARTQRNGERVRALP